MKTFMILGGSKGLGDAFVKGLPDPGDNVWIISRGRPASLERDDGVHRHWIEADLSSQTARTVIAAAVNDVTIDVLIYNVGIWETGGFRDTYDFEQEEPDAISNIITVNLTSAITCIQALLPNVRRSDNGKIFLIGSTAGLENTDYKQVAFAASKFGLRGISNALREHVRKDAIGVTCINPGSLTAKIPYEEGAEKALSAFNGQLIPVHDVVALVKCVAGLSKASCVKEINMPAMFDTDA